MSVAPKVAICIPYYHGFHAEMATSLFRLGLFSAPHIQAACISSKSCYVEDNRNACIEYALEMKVDWDWVLWIDTDMVFPGDGLLRLISHDKDIIGANYRQRTPPYKHAGIYKEPATKDLLLASGLHEMVQMPTGFLLTRFDVYRKMEYPWFKPGTRNEPRDDIYFCRKAVSLGYRIWTDHDITRQVIHMDEQQIGWFTPEQLRPIERGTSLDNVSAAEAGKARAAQSGEKFRAA